jgi:hypothetical protein
MKSPSGRIGRIARNLHPDGYGAFAHQSPKGSTHTSKKIRELKHNVGIGQPLEKLYTQALRQQLGNAGVLEHKNLSGRVNWTTKGLRLYSYGTIAH